MKNNTYDAIVVGTGVSGGWAAKELTEKGLKTLVLERGRDVRHGEYPTATHDPWQLSYGGRPTQEDLARQSVQARTGYTITQASKHWFVDDIDNPYTEIKRFDWMRGYHVGGRSLTSRRMRSMGMASTGLSAMTISLPGTTTSNLSSASVARQKDCRSCQTENFRSRWK
jgi:choline dehydrogenase-like flavoprotein